MGVNYYFKERGSSMIQIETKLSNIDIEEFALGGDQQAKQLLATIQQLQTSAKQYAERKEQEVIREISSKAQQAMAITAVPAFRTGVEVEPWEKLLDICSDVVDALSPAEEVE